MGEQSNTTLRWEFVVQEKMQPHFSGKTVIAGHTPQTSGEPLDLGFLKVIDTDCSRGGWLTAMECRTGEVSQTNQEGEFRQG
jgi:serine/threonine protein phosphatase 1